jgi:hypothetical protein
VRFWVRTFPANAIQVFGLFRDFGERLDRAKGNMRKPEDRVLAQILSLLKPEGNSTANRTTARTELRQCFCIVGVCLEVQ